MAFTPANTDTDVPTSCYACGRHASSVGITMNEELQYLCPECSMLANRIRRVKEFDGYEDRAIDGAVEAAGAYMDRLGKTDLCEFDAGEAATLCRVIVRGFGDRLRPGRPRQAIRPA